MAVAQPPKIAEGPYQGNVGLETPQVERGQHGPADGKLLVRSLATPAGTVESVSVLGVDEKVTWQQTAEGLAVTVPSRQVSPYTCAPKIAGSNLKPAPIPEVFTVVSPDAQGDYLLLPDDANLHGDQIKTEAQGGQPNIGFWDNATDWVSWKVKCATSS